MAVLRSPGLIGVLLCAPLSCSGCGGPKTPATASVTGTVTYKGSPVDSATVVFARPDGGRPATGITDSRGRFKLSTFGSEDGAVPGDYKVTVTKTAIDDKAGALTYEQLSELQSKGQAPPSDTKNALPQRYASAATTDLAFSVTASGNDFTIELKD